MSELGQVPNMLFVSFIHSKSFLFFERNAQREIHNLSAMIGYQ